MRSLSFVRRSKLAIVAASSAVIVAGWWATDALASVPQNQNQFSYHDMVNRDWSYPLGDGKDGMWNWDFEKTYAGNAPPTAPQASHPVNIIFYDGANLDKVKAGLSQQGYCCGGNDAKGVFYDSSTHYNASNGVNTFDNYTDSGRKQCTPPGAAVRQCGTGWTNNHYRIYAADRTNAAEEALFGQNPSDIYNGYTLNWGYWVFGSAHLDVDEDCACPDAAYGYENDARDQLAADARLVWGDANVHGGQEFMGNAYTDTYTNPPNSPDNVPHITYYTRSDGTATAIDVP